MSEFEYKLEKELTESEAYFSFKANFQQSPVTWHIHLQTCKSRINQGDPRQFIDIEKNQQEGHYSACICLNIPRVTTADIIKTIIMVRQYKKLSLGRHEYGESVPAHRFDSK